MAKYQLRIELLSDLCVSDGGVYNSMVDTDCCHDEMGFPYIPAKRIKGCLRECAQELNDWGKNIDINEIFGESGRSGKGDSDKRAGLRIGNAYLSGFEDMRKDAAEHSGHILFHPQHVLDRFTSLRTQTAVSQETGVADPHSLRTMRVINKGLVFTAEVDMPASALGSMESCCAVFQQMGISRTRGFGEVKATITPAEPEANGAGNAAAGTSDLPVLTPHADYLDYVITLKEPMICKSIAGGEARTLDYIEGSKVLGLILERLRKQQGGQTAAGCFLQGGTIICSNAYIGCGGERFTEVPAYIYSIKNNKDDYVDRRIQRHNPEGIQLSQMKHCYCLKKGKDFLTMDVNVEERYHHRRAADKSIGRAISTEEGSDFYQISSIMAGQSFYGRIYGTEEQVKTVFHCLEVESDASLGYGRSAEYGKCSVRVIRTGDSKAETEKAVFASDLIFELNSPTVIYNDKAMCTVDREELVAEILSALKIDRADLLEYETYVNFTTLGGFNVTWGRRKPTIPVFDKGTSVCLRLKKKIIVPPVLFIGERCAEGYGEVSVSAEDICSQNGADITCTHNDPEKVTADIRSGSIISLDPFSTENPLKMAAETAVTGLQKEKMVIVPGSLGEALADRMFLVWIGAVTREKGKKLFEGAPEKYRPTISNMLTGFEEYQDISQVEQMVISRYGKKSEKKEKKLEYAQEILDRAKEGITGVKEVFCEEHGIDQWEWTTDQSSRYQMRYLQELLIAMKLYIRGTQIDKQEG